jgi:FLYWCH zinc finger domain
MGMKKLFVFQKPSINLSLSIVSLSFSLFKTLTANGKLHFILSRWGGKLLVVNNFLFSSNKRQNDVEYWRCTFCSARKKDPCQVRCRTGNGKILKITAQHNHPPQLTLKAKIIK